MLTPVATRRSVSWLIALRILEGIAQVQYSSSHMQLNPSLVGEVGGEGFFSSELSIYLEFWELQWFRPMRKSETKMAEIDVRSL